MFNNKEDTVKPTTETKSQFNRSQTMIGKNKESIADKRDEIANLVAQGVSSMILSKKITES